MKQADRGVLDDALRRARTAAYPPGGFLGQESFMSAEEIGTLAEQAGVRAGARVLDVCCGVAGPGRHLTAVTGCDYLGVDCDPTAVALARARSEGLPCRFLTARVPPLPTGPFDVVLLLETMLAFPDKQALLGQVAAVLAPGGRFAFTVEEGHPLTDAERAAMPAGDTVWPVPLGELQGALERTGLEVRWIDERTDAHRALAARLATAFLDDRQHIAAVLGAAAVDELVTAHLQWCAWLATGRVRKFAVVAEQVRG